MNKYRFNLAKPRGIQGCFFSCGPVLVSQTMHSVRSCPQNVQHTCSDKLGCIKLEQHSNDFGLKSRLTLCGASFGFCDLCLLCLRGVWARREPFVASLGRFLNFSGASLGAS